MVTPRVIDWRKLTAKDIIKYDSEGMTVPSEYLSWAKSFQVDLEKNDTDDTTYEMAISKPTIQPQRTRTGNNNNQNTETSEVDMDNQNPQATSNQNTTDTENTTNSTQNTENKKTEETNGVTNQDGTVQEGETTEETDNTTEATTGEDGEENLTAEEKKKKMEDDGESFSKIAATFMNDSDEKADASDTSSTTVNAIGESSDNAIAALDSYMNDLLAQAGDIESQINTLKNKNGKNQNNFAKMLRLQQELKDLGTTGQNVALGYDSDLNMYTQTIDEGTNIGLDAQDYGNTTADMGRELKRNIWNMAFGRRVENSGKNAVSAGESTQETSMSVSERNNTNIRTVQQHQTTINDRTGVSSAEVASDNQNNQQNGNETAKTTGSTPKANTADTKTASTEKTNKLGEKQETPAQKIAQEEDNTSDDKKTDVEKKEEKIASGNLDEILKRKMRKGETV